MIEDHSLLGDPKLTLLTESEMELFAQLGVTGCEDMNILSYSQLLLNRTEWYQRKLAQKLQSVMIPVSQ